MWVSKILTPSLQYPNRSRYVRCRAKAQKKRVVVVGNGWAALGSAHHLSKQGFDVILLDSQGGKTTSYDSVEVGIQGFRYPYRNIFSLVDELGIQPFTNWTRSAQYSPEGLEQDFDVMWCRGTLKEKIFMPWLELMKIKGCELHQKRRVTDFSLNEDTGCISEVVCGEVRYAVDAVVLAVGVSTLQSIVMNSFVLQARQEFLNIMNLAAIDVLSVRLRLDRNVNIPKASNACFGFDDSSGWTFFDLNAIYDEYKDEPVTILEANFYHANQLLPLKDDQIVAKVMSYLSKYIKEFEQASVLEKVVTRLPKSATHFFPGSYDYMMRGSTTFPNLFMAGDWIINRHGSWSQEKAYVSGLEAANRVIDYLGEGNFAKIMAVEEDEPHFQTLRSFNRSIAEIRAQLPLSDFFL